MTHLKKLLVVFCLLASASFAEASGVISEQIYFLGEDEPEGYDWKTVDVYIDCKTSFLPGRGGGAVSNMRGTIPNLVE